MKTNDNGKLKKLFAVLLVLDLAGIVSALIALVPSFGDMAGEGQLMLGITLAMSAIMLAFMLFEILAKLFLLRSLSPNFSWASGRKGYRAAAKLLLLLNLGAAVLFFLATGGEGATLLNQARMYLSVLASAAEVIAVIFYLRKAKKLHAEATQPTA